jgi:hypothetical protein
MRNKYNISTENREGKGLRHGSEDNIRTDLKEIEYELMGCIHRGQDSGTGRGFL